MKFREVHIHGNSEAGVEITALLEHLEARHLPEASVDWINEQIKGWNSKKVASNDDEKELKLLKKDVLDYLRKQHNLVAEGYYSTLWMTLGISAFGLPFGVVLYALTDNSAFIAVGLPLGIAFGFAFGAFLDRKAEKENRVMKFSKKRAKP